jgi:hypothetical protein
VGSLKPLRKVAHCTTHTRIGSWSDGHFPEHLTTRSSLNAYIHIIRNEGHCTPVMT